MVVGRLPQPRPTVDPAATLVEIPGSQRFPARGARRLGTAEETASADVTVLLRRPTRSPAPLAALGAGRRSRRNWFSREEFAHAHGADEEDVRLVREFARAHGLRVAAVHLPSRTIHLAGSVGDLARAFGATLYRYVGPRGSYRGREGALLVPGTLRNVIVGVFGLDDRPQAIPHVRPRPTRAAAAPSYTPPQLAAAYGFPTGGNGTGQCIGLIELGGGYQASDLATYFASLGLVTPTVTPVGVDGASNAPTGNPSGPDGEVTLDVEVAGSVASGARIAVYFAPNTDQGFLDAVVAAIHDTTNAPNLVSISWGGPEETWSAQARTAFQSAFEDAASLGITVLAAAGDDGATDGSSNGALEVDFPASAPGAIGCGGTTLTITGSAITGETTWNELAHGEGATGGGVSEVFPLPSFQSGVPVPAAPNGFVGRGVPDVAADADPATGYGVLVDGQSLVLGGTSAVAPLWAGLLARINSILGTPVGFVTPDLYADASAFRDITTGGNGGYNAGPGWDPCTGLGSPNGSALLAALQASPPAPAPPA
jgi:kumamolisin